MPSQALPTMGETAAEPAWQGDLTAVPTGCPACPMPPAGCPCPSPPKGWQVLPVPGITSPFPRSISTGQRLGDKGTWLPPQGEGTGEGTRLPPLTGVGGGLAGLASGGSFAGEGVCGAELAGGGAGGRGVGTGFAGEALGGISHPWQQGGAQGEGAFGRGQ